MIVNKLGKNKYSVSVERVIELGKEFGIYPSYGYPGVEPGVVVVVDLISPEEYKDTPHRFPDITDFIGADEDTKEIYKDTVWVGYKYPVGENSDEVFYFPMEDFIDHTSIIS